MLQRYNCVAEKECSSRDGPVISEGPVISDAHTVKAGTVKAETDKSFSELIDNGGLLELVQAVPSMEATAGAGNIM